MDAKNLTFFEKKLTEEKEDLKKELAEISQRNPKNPDTWTPTSGSIEVDAADENEVADKLEEYEENSAIVKQLEAQFIEVKEALRRIRNGTYGICEVCGKPIEHDRLEANPSARVSLKHDHPKNKA